MFKIPVAQHLTDDQYSTFMKTYANHNSSMSFKERVKYTASNIIKVDVNQSEDVLNVHYSDGSSWCYMSDGTWK